MPDNHTPDERAALSETAERLLKDPQGFWVMLAFDGSSGADNKAIAMMSLNECKALYAHGNFGEIAELYIDPDFRSSGHGARLIEHAAEFGRKRGWPFLEVGAPDVPRWQRTVNFYKRCGFSEIGPRLELEL